MIRRYLVIYQIGSGHMSAYVPDVPGCSSIGHSLEELRENIHDELEFHLERMALEGRSLQEPFMGMDDVPAGTHAEWMMVKPMPEEKALSLDAKIRRRLRRPFGFKWNWFSRSVAGVKVRTTFV
jgi:predicted RNase H-like HicB family nuclease